jgi:hypothetical protein
MMKRIEIGQEVVSRRVADELVLVHLGRNEIYSLNETGARLWELLEEDHTLEGALQRIISEYDVDEQQARKEAEALLRNLADEGLVTLVP